MTSYKFGMLCYYMPVAFGNILQGHILHKKKISQLALASLQTSCEQLLITLLMSSNLSQGCSNSCKKSLHKLFHKLLFTSSLFVTTIIGASCKQLVSINSIGTAWFPVQFGNNMHKSVFNDAKICKYMLFLNLHEKPCYTC